jgi:pimeloyl-ACP methyl ester carboxylesterase
MKFFSALRSFSILALALIPFVYPLKGQSQVITTSSVKNIVLVHGAWADGSSWSKVIPILQERGLHVVAVQNPLTSFADDVASTRRLIDAQDGPVLLVGHSYGGVVITEAGNNPKVAGLVYVAAFAPDQGESAASQGKPYGPTPGLAELRPIGDGFLVLTQKGIQEDFAPDLTTEEKIIMTATQVPTQSAVLASTISAPAWRAKPTWFVIASNDRMISPKQEIDSAQKMKAKTLTLPTSHVPMLSRPKEVAAFIVEAAQGKSQAAANW